MPSSSAVHPVSSSELSSSAGADNIPLLDGATSAAWAEPGDASPPGEFHWLHDDTKYRAVENKKRLRNLGQKTKSAKDNGWTHTKLFFSHCWRQADSQKRKRMLFSAMSDRGGVMWADFLDLQAQGPVPWRKEIGSAIKECSKVVVVIDFEYLLSYNCLEELAYAIHYSKPIVPIILCQKAWNLLTVPGGCSEVWTREPASGSSPLSAYAGSPFGPKGIAFDFDCANRIYDTLAAINFCPCRDLEANSMGDAAMAERMVLFVEEDLDYTKQHAFLMSQADNWEGADKPDKMLLENKATISYWEQWISVAKKAAMFPPPTLGQEEFVDVSKMRQKKRQRFLKGLAIAAVWAIFLLMVAAIILAVWALQQQQMARSNELDAQASATEARQQESIARQQEQRARYQQMVAASMVLSSTKSPDSSSEARAVLRAAEIAQLVGVPTLVAPALQQAVEHLLTRPYMSFDMTSHSARVTALSFSPDGRYLASGARDYTVQIRSLQLPSTGLLPEYEPDVFLPAPGTVSSLSWSKSGDLLAAGCMLDDRVGGANADAGASVMVWRRDSSRKCWTELFLLGGPWMDTPQALAWSPDSKFLASVGDDAQHFVWDIASAVSAGVSHPPAAQPLGVDGTSRLLAIDWSPDGRLVVIGGIKDRVRLLDYFPPGRRPYSGNVSELEPVVVAEYDVDKDIADVKFSGDGTSLACSTDDGIVWIFDIVVEQNPANITGGGGVESHQNFTLSPSQVLEEHKDNVEGVAWGFGDDTVVSWSQDYTVQVHQRNSTPGDTEGNFVLQQELQVPSIPFSGAVSPQAADFFVAGLEANTMRGFRKAAGIGSLGPEGFKMACHAEVKEAFGYDVFDVRSWTFSADGDRFAVGSYRGHLCIWERADSSGWHLSAVIEAEQRPGSSKRRAKRTMEFAPSGRKLVSGDDRSRIYLWQFEEDTSEWKASGQRQFPELSDKVRAVGWSADESWVAAGSSKGLIALWNVDGTNSSVQLLEGHEGQVSAVAWRPFLDEDGCYILASSSTDLSTRLWQLCPDQEQGGGVMSVMSQSVLGRHEAAVYVLQWSSNGLLAAGDQGSTIVVYSSPGGGAMSSNQSLTGHRGSIDSISWNPSGDFLASAGDDSTVHVWNLTDWESPATSWSAIRRCEKLQWIGGEPERLACARPNAANGGPNPMTEDPPYNAYIEYNLLGYDYQLELLRNLAYGSLAEQDLKILGYSSIAESVLNEDQFPVNPNSQTGICSATG